MAEPHSTAATPPPAESAPNSSQTRLRSRETQHVSVTSGAANWSTVCVRDDSWSCFAVVFSFWFFVSVTMILGVYGTVNVVLGPRTSIVYHPSPLFVQYVKVENVDEKAGPAPILYGTYKNPSLDVVTTWGETRNVSLPPGSHKEWKYYLNRGSEVNISYHVSSEDSSIFLIIADGADSLSQWLEDPTHPNTTLSWNMILGTGMIRQEILWSSGYYVAVGNLGEEVEVELNLSVKALLHNTTNAYYKCVLTSACSLNIFFPEGNAAVIVSPGPQQNTSNEWYVTISYGPRWVTYIIGIGGMTLLMFWAFNCLSKIHGPHEDTGGVRPEGTTPQRAPLLSQKDDDLSSWGSSYDSLSQDEEDLDFLPAGSIDGNVLGEGETSNSTRRLCAICFDAPRDCFFLPCGHCAACFPCGTRLAEAAGTCPVCRRNMKKVRKIFTV